MTSTIKAHNILTDTFNVQLTYASTSNPYATGSINVAKEGYIPISASFTITGTGGSTVYPSIFRLNENDVVEYAFRNSSGVSSTTQNRLAVTVKYIRA